MFQKKSHTVSEKLEAINVRIAELTKKRETKIKDIEERKGDAAKHLSTLAMNDDDSTATEGLKTTRKSLERLTETLNDTTEQLALLEGQKSKLAIEFMEAQTRDLPPLMEEVATAYNALLEESLKLVETLRSLHAQMEVRSDEFKKLTSEYGECCIQLQIVKPLDLKQGLGQSRFPTIGFQLTDFDFFLGTLLDYQSRVEGREAFLASNPNFEKRLAEIQGRDAEPYELPKMTEMFGKIQP